MEAGGTHLFLCAVSSWCSSGPRHSISFAAAGWFLAIATRSTSAILAAGISYSSLGDGFVVLSLFWLQPLYLHRPPTETGPLAVFANFEFGSFADWILAQDQPSG